MQALFNNDGLEVNYLHQLGIFYLKRCLRHEHEPIQLWLRDLNGIIRKWSTGSASFIVANSSPGGISTSTERTKYEARAYSSILSKQNASSIFEETK